MRPCREGSALVAKRSVPTAATYISPSTSQSVNLSAPRADAALLDGAINYCRYQHRTLAGAVCVLGNRHAMSTIGRRRWKVLFALLLITQLAAVIGYHHGDLDETVEHIKIGKRRTVPFPWAHSSGIIVKKKTTLAQVDCSMVRPRMWSSPSSTRSRRSTTRSCRTRTTSSRRRQCR